MAGGIAGWLASIVAGTNARMGCLLNIVVGVLGAVIGGWIFRSLDIAAPGGLLFGTIVTAFVGATIFLVVLKFIAGRT
ncbi:MAG: GlsB/YeaQ/YmgE family stress response membrane protein [Actinomycetota bacterium]